jgi:hypothetical protein
MVGSLGVHFQTVPNETRRSGDAVRSAFHVHHVSLPPMNVERSTAIPLRFDAIVFIDACVCRISVFDATR